MAEPLEERERGAAGQRRGGETEERGGERGGERAVPLPSCELADEEHFCILILSAPLLHP
jgi:hypothetical protein